MSTAVTMGPRWRNNPFDRHSQSPSTSPMVSSPRPRSSVLTSPHASPSPITHNRNQSFSAFGASGLSPANTVRERSNSSRSGNAACSTFAPQPIKDTELRREDERISRIEGENDFSGRRYVWLQDPKSAFVKGWVVNEVADNRMVVQCEDGSQREVDSKSVDQVNPAKFDKADDMAELTHLNEASVVHNLHMRYQSDLIYTYSGLFLVTINPYSPLPIYSNEYMKMYKGRNREESKPHIYAMADGAFRNLVEEGENQSILVTGESGAGKTENTKKVIQYLAAVATSDTPGSRSGTGHLSNLSQQILRANPILEAFGNAQTVRNNNSSRFGKFIRIEFTRSGQIAGAFIDWYLLEKSRVVKLNCNERNYHIFYQFLRGADSRLKEDFLLDGRGVDDFIYTRDGNEMIAGISDVDEWNALLEAFRIMGFSDVEQKSIICTVAIVLLLGNITVTKESLRADQANLTKEAYVEVEKVCHLLKIPQEPFIQGLLHPKVKAGKEWVEKVQTPEQVRSSLDALSKGIYERAFGDLVSRINRQLDRAGVGLEDSCFIGVLDIAGFEIFEENSFEQLCINYTNEKLQQFFNHHMFVLEQEEYAREQIEWKFIDFGKDLQPTIELIEVPNPIGIFSCLDEDSVMPKATDKSFTEKLHGLWDRKTPKYKPSRLAQGFILTHYAAEVEYSTVGWLEKNKDPLNESITRLLASSEDKHIATLFADCAEPDDECGAMRSRVKKGLFRTVAQRHKEELSSLMSQLHSTHPHFVRCILPNHKKKPKQFSAPLVLDQLRCNGVLEGIRIARTGFPNRLPFSEFRQRYEVLCKSMPKGCLEGQAAARIILEKLELDSALYRVGLTKVFFRAGVLAELEEKRDTLIGDIMSRFQSIARGSTQRRFANKRLYRAEATRIIQHNFQIYVDLRNNPWWMLLARMKPLLGTSRTSAEVKKRDETIEKLELRMQQQHGERRKLEEERRRADSEVQRIRKTLESERSLALDKEEIFKRLQIRETELNEKLTIANNSNKMSTTEVKRKDEMIQQLEKNVQIRETELNEKLTIANNNNKMSATEVKRKDEIIQQLEKNVQEQVNQRLRLENECRQANSEVQRLFQALDTERSLTLEKEKILERLQIREAELSAKLVGAIKDEESIEDQFSNLRIRLDAESSKAMDLASNLNLYKRRADEYFSKLEQAEIAVLKASRAEQTSKAQALETEEACAKIVAERKQMDATVEELQRQNRHFEGKIEDFTADLESALQAKKRLQSELEEYRSQRAMDIEVKESSMEQTRKKYQSEFSILTKELEVERSNLIHLRSENTRLRDEMEELRSKWDNEVLNSSTWAKETSRLESALQDVSRSKEEAVNALKEAQGKVTSLSSQIRKLRTSVDDGVAERERLKEEKRILETRLSESNERLEEFARGQNPSLHNIADMDRELLDVKNHLAQQKDVAAAAAGKMRRAEAIALEMQKDMATERDLNARLHKDKAALEKNLKDLQGRVVDLETKGYSSSSQDVRFLTSRIQELEHQLETQESQHASSLRSVRNHDRMVRDLHVQITRRDKQAAQLADDVSKGREKIERLQQEVQELHAEEAKSQLAARRAERELREEREKGLMLERELEGWKGLRMERGSRPTEWGGDRRISGEGFGRRRLSDTKGFL